MQTSWANTVGTDRGDTPSAFLWVPILLLNPMAHSATPRNCEPSGGWIVQFSARPCAHSRTLRSRRFPLLAATHRSSGLPVRLLRLTLALLSLVGACHNQRRRPGNFGAEVNEVIADFVAGKLDPQTAAR